MRDTKIPFSKQNMGDRKKTLECEMVCLKQVYNFLSSHFLIGCIFIVSMKKIPLKIKNLIFS